MAESQKKDECTVIKLEPRLGDCDTITTEEGETKTVDKFVRDKRAKDLGDETITVHDLRRQEMGRDRRKSRKRDGNRGRQTAHYPVYDPKKAFDESGFVKCIGVDMPNINEKGLTDEVAKADFETQSLRRSFEKESREIWNSTSNLKGQVKTTIWQFTIWVMIFSNHVVQLKSGWLKQVRSILDTWNEGKNAVSFRKATDTTVYGTLRKIADKDFAISEFYYEPPIQKSSNPKKQLFGLHPNILYIDRQHIYDMMIKSNPQKGWDILNRYCDKEDKLYNKNIANMVKGHLVEKPEPFTGVEEVTTEEDIELPDSDLSNTIAGQLVSAIRDNMDDAELGRFVKQSAEPIANLIKLLFEGSKLSGEIDIKLKLKL